MKKLSIIIAALLVSALILSGCGTLTDFIPGRNQDSGTVKNDKSDIKWELDGDGTLLLSGTGSAEAIPFDKLDRESIKKIVIEDGITAIGDAAFEGLGKVTEVIIPETVTSIGDSAFKDCVSIKELRIPDSVKEICGNTFENWEDTQKIIADWYEGSVAYWEEWYRFSKEFADELKKNADGFEIDDDVKARISTWWDEWKDSEYWKENGDRIAEKADSWFSYWNGFGEYIASDDRSVPENGDSWWSDAKDILAYIDSRSRGEDAEVPPSIAEFIEEHKDEIDGARKFLEGIKEKIGSVKSDDLGEFFREAEGAIEKYFKKSGNNQ